MSTNYLFIPLHRFVKGHHYCEGRGWPRQRTQPTWPGSMAICHPTLTWPVLKWRTTTNNWYLVFLGKTHQPFTEVGWIGLIVMLLTPTRPMTVPFCHLCIADIINTMMYTRNNSSSFDQIQRLKLMPNPVIALACTAVSPFNSSLILQSQLDFMDLGSLGQVVWRQIAIEVSIFLRVKVGGLLQGSSSRPWGLCGD